MHKARYIVILICAMLLGGNALAQSDDIEVTDSTSTDWGDGTVGGLNPNLPDEPVTSLTLSQNQLMLEGGQCVRLVATVNPRAKNKKILWTSANSDIASVDADGTVMGLSIGTTTITATAAGNTALKQTCLAIVTSDYISVSGYILPWGRDEAWTMKYQQVEYSMDPGDISWTRPDYNDSNWPTLMGPIGDKGERNFEWEGDWNGYNLRRTFNMSVVDPNSIFTFSAIHDDDLWIYLNGELVAYFDGWSSDSERSINIPSDKFIKGRNVLALRIMEAEGGQYLDYSLYQRRPRISQHNVVLPDVSFEFYYDARDYAPEDQCIPNHIYANLKDAQLQLTENLPSIIEEGKALRINDRCEGFIDKWEKGSTESGAYFYRHGQDCMTIVAKVAARLNTGNVCDFVTNRGNEYNYMWRIGDHNSMFLHTNFGYNGSGRVMQLDSETPQILSVRADGVNNYILLDNLTTGEHKRVNGIYWGEGDSVFKIFYNNDGEYYLGDFYWIYYSFELLTDAQLEEFGKPDFEDAINKPNYSSADNCMYDLNGRKLSAPQKGINIIRYSDGSSRKVLFK